LAIDEAPAAGIGLDFRNRALGLGLTLAKLLEIEPDRLEDVEAVVDAGKALLDFDLVLRQRLDAGVERRFACGLELVDGLP